MILDLLKGAASAARACHAQYHDAQDAIQEAAVSALQAGDRAMTCAFGYTVAKRVLSQARPSFSRVPDSYPDRTSIDVTPIARALTRAGADRWAKARKLERARIRARLAIALREEGWVL